MLMMSSSLPFTTTLRVTPESCGIAILFSEFSPCASSFLACTTCDQSGVPP